MIHNILAQDKLVQKRRRVLHNSICLQIRLNVYLKCLNCFPMILFFSGTLIIFLFIACALYLAKNKESMQYSTITLSGIAANPKYTNIVRILCWSVCLLIFPFTYQLIQIFGIPFQSYTFSIGMLASISLFMTALTIYEPDQKLHITVSYIFYISLLILPLEICIKLILESNSIVAWGIIFINFFAGAFSLLHIKNLKGVPNGFTEIIVMVGGSIWVIIFSFLDFISI